MPLVICEGKFGTIDAEDSPFCRYYMAFFGFFSPNIYFSKIYLMLILFFPYLVFLLVLLAILPYLEL